MQIMNIACSSFNDGAMIPSRYTCDGDNISPGLSWDGVPPGTTGFVLICDDPDAPGGNWDHWLLFNIPGDCRFLPENFLLAEKGEPSIKGGTNDFRLLDYGGPCPPGGVHRYFFKLYALDVLLDLPEGARKGDIEAAMSGHILAEGKIMGRYTRKK